MINAAYYFHKLISSEYHHRQAIVMQGSDKHIKERFENDLFRGQARSISFPQRLLVSQETGIASDSHLHAYEWTLYAKLLFHLLSILSLLMVALVN